MADAALQAGPGPSPPGHSLPSFPVTQGQEPLVTQSQPFSDRSCLMNQLPLLQHREGQENPESKGLPLHGGQYSPPVSPTCTPRLLRSQMPMSTLIHPLPCPGWAPGSLPTVPPPSLTQMGTLLSHLHLAKQSWKSSKGSFLGNEGAWQRKGGKKETALARRQDANCAPVRGPRGS